MLSSQTVDVLRFSAGWRRGKERTSAGFFLAYQLDLKQESALSALSLLISSLCGGLTPTAVDSIDFGRRHQCDGMATVGLYWWMLSESKVFFRLIRTASTNRHPACHQNQRNPLECWSTRWKTTGPNYQSTGAAPPRVRGVELTLVRATIQPG